MKIVLAGSADPQLEELLRDLGELSPIADLAALSKAKPAVPPHVIVLDTRDRAGIPAELVDVRRALPDAGVIVVSESLDPTKMLEAMRAGVNEFLSAPVSAEEVRKAVDRVRALQAGPQVGRVYAFLGAKGGVGTTTVAVNVATALAQARAGRVLFIDLHPTYGDAGLFFGVEPRFSVLDALENTHRLDAAYLKGLVAKTKTGLDLLGSSSRASVTVYDATRIRALLDFASKQYAHVVLDVPRSDSAAMEALDAAASIVVIANQELSTVRGAARMVAALRQRYGRERVQVVVSRYDPAAAFGQEDIEKVTGGAIRHMFPSNYRLAVDALNKGQPLVVENHNKLAGSIVGFARHLGGIAPKANAEPAKSGGLFSRLTGRG